MSHPQRCRYLLARLAFAGILGTRPYRTPPGQGLESGTFPARQRAAGRREQKRNEACKPQATQTHHGKRRTGQPTPRRTPLSFSTSRLTLSRFCRSLLLLLLLILLLFLLLFSSSLAQQIPASSSPIQPTSTSPRLLLPMREAGSDKALDRLSPATYLYNHSTCPCSSCSCSSCSHLWIVTKLQLPWLISPKTQSARSRTSVNSKPLQANAYNALTSCRGLLVRYSLNHEFGI
ncbi:hypothetical protein HDV57DRAFT_424308 [Trichoderma longibrachiatum]